MSLLSEILSPDRVFMDLKPAPKAELLRAMADRLAEMEAIQDAELLTSRLVARENLITTGVKAGFAFPHVFTPQVVELGLTVGVVPGGVDYASLDGAPVEFILLLLGPPRRQEEHLRVLARLSRVAAEPDMLARLRAAETPGKIVSIFRESDRSLAEAV